MDDGSFCSRCGKTFSSGKLRTLSLLVFSRIFSGLDCFRSFGFVCEISYARGSCGDTEGVSFAEFLRRVEGSSSRKKVAFLRNGKVKCFLRWRTLSLSPFEIKCV